MSVAETTVRRIPKRRSPFADFFHRLVKEKPLGTIGAAIFLILLLVGIFADLLAPFGVNQLLPGMALKGPSAAHWLGTDNLGRDLLSRIIFGARLSVIVAFGATSLSIIISVLIGLTTGFFGGKYDLVMQRFVDAWMAFPGLIVLIVAVSLIGAGMGQIIVVLGLQFGIAGSRIVRGAVVSAKENVYVQASRSIGSTNSRTLYRHILPNIMAPIIILFTTRLGAVVLSEASLSFLGLGIPPPAPSWGGMLSGSGRTYMFLAPWLAIWPGLALTIVVYAVNVFGDAMRDLLDPRLRGGLGRYAGVKISKRIKEHLQQHG